MKVISVKQPHADLIVHGDKWCENRTWSTRYRGPLLIHASSRPCNDSCEYFEDLGMQLSQSPGEMATGSIVGKVDLIDVVRSHDVLRIIFGRKPELPVSDSTKKLIANSSQNSHIHVANSGYCFILSNPRPVEVPVRARGRLNLWDAPLQLSQKIKVQEGDRRYIGWCQAAYEE